MTSKVERIKAVSAAILPVAAELLKEWLPGGTLRGNEYTARNPMRGDRRAGSFSISTTRGRWNDFADPEAQGGDLVSLRAYLLGCNQLEAARLIDREQGLGIFDEQDPQELAKRRRELEARARQQSQAAEALRKRQQEHARQLARTLWQRGSRASGAGGPPHPYLKRKAVRGHNLRTLPERDSPGRRVLLVPVCDGRRLVNLQLIDEDGNKRFLSKGQIMGCYAPLGPVIPHPGGQIAVYVCEGWATGATLLENHGVAVACALFAANLEPVARRLRQHYGSAREIVIAGDDDRKSPGNAGRRYAQKAADAIRARAIFPPFPEGAPRGLSDFNDLYLWEMRQGAGPSHGTAELPHV